MLPLVKIPTVVSDFKNKVDPVGSSMLNSKSDFSTGRSELSTPTQTQYDTQCTRDCYSTLSLSAINEQIDPKAASFKDMNFPEI